jgi:hypothetical protein
MTITTRTGQVTSRARGRTVHTVKITLRGVPTADLASAAGALRLHVG